VVRLGGFLAFFGLGSALLHFTSVQFKLLMWAEPMQPLLGLGVGALGVIILVIKFATAKEQPAQAPQQFGPPPGYPPQPGPGQFAPPPPGPFGPQYVPPQPGPQFAPQPGGAQFGPARFGPAGFPPAGQQQPFGPRQGTPPGQGEPVLGRPQFAPRVPRQFGPRG
jgi:hypothetical protein